MYNWMAQFYHVDECDGMQRYTPRYWVKLPGFCVYKADDEYQAGCDRLRKRIVVSSGMLRDFTYSELMAVLYHEERHFRHGKITGAIFMACTSIAATGMIYGGFTHNPLIIAGSPFVFHLTGFVARLCELDADRHAAKKGSASYMIMALQRMGKFDLKNWRQVAFSSMLVGPSHPTMKRRIKKLRKFNNKQGGNK